MEGEPALRPLTRRIKDRLHLKTHCVGCYLVLLSRETVSSDNGGLELPAVIFRDKSSGRRTIGNGPTALIYLTIVSTLRLSLKFREKESFHVVAQSAAGNSSNLLHAKPCRTESSERFVVLVVTP